ncbi:MAG TPA: hypothetical protein DCO68_04415 [Methylophilaceae bacterium]|nr:hypothetical protein [Methylophilaceae bacterium]HAJ71302.1 hypothetical protein [Methylophilaceae bacterium]
MSPVLISKNDVKDFVINLLINEKEIDANILNPESKLKEIGIDSFGFLEIIFSIEHEFDIKFPQEFQDIVTLQDCLDITYNLIIDKNKTRTS